VALDETTAAFAAAAAADGITFASRTFDWLGEQGHVGLERVARTRRDPALVAPAKAAIALLQAIYARLRGDESVLRASRENLLLPVEAGPEDDTGEDPFWEIGPDHPEYGHWLALSTPGEDPRPRLRQKLSPREN